MDDGGFDFRRPPSERREPRPFEPPPWEQGAFEDLEKKRAQEREREEERPAEAEDQRSEVAEPLEEPKPVAETVDVPAKQKQQCPAEPGVDEKAVIEMMADLAAEEPRQDYSGVSVLVGWAMAALGVVLMVWAMAAFVGAAKTGLLGQIGGAGLAFFGAFFLGVGAWMVYKAFKQRGVL